MRIRKNAKFSTLSCTNTNVYNNGNLQKTNNLCQLNQSPWDIITFPSSDSHQFDDYEICYNVDHAGDFERKITLGDGLASVETFEGENYNRLVDPKNICKEILGFEVGEMNEVLEEILLCDVRDAKGWQCGKVVKKGETMCDHHIIQLQNDTVWTVKKKPNPGNGLGPMTEARSRETKKRASTSPYEFYYYSGFGPSWAKKRGTASTFSNVYNEPAKVVSNDNTIKETSSITNDTGIRKGKEDGKGFEPETSEVGPAKIEQANIVENNKKGKTGKKRGRKLMKTRSLKSLL